MSGDPTVRSAALRRALPLLASCAALVCAVPAAARLEPVRHPGPRVHIGTFPFHTGGATRVPSCRTARLAAAHDAQARTPRRTVACVSACCLRAADSCRAPDPCLDPAGADRPALPDRPERADRVAPRREAADAGPAALGHEGLSERHVHARARPLAVHHRRGRPAKRVERRWKRDQDRSRRRRHRPVEPVLRSVRASRTRRASRAAAGSGRLPKVIVARVFPGPNAGEPGRLAVDPRLLVPRHARRRDRSRRLRDDRACGCRPPAGSPA